jgi:hypothetical protein
MPIRSARCAASGVRRRRAREQAALSLWGGGGCLCWKGAGWLAGSMARWLRGWFVCGRVGVGHRACVGRRPACCPRRCRTPCGRDSPSIVDSGHVSLFVILSIFLQCCGRYPIASTPTFGGCPRVRVDNIGRWLHRHTSEGMAWA